MSELPLRNNPEYVEHHPDAVQDGNKAAYEAYAADLKFNEIGVHNEALKNVQDSINSGERVMPAAFVRSEETKRRVAEAAIQSGDFRHIDEIFSEPREPHSERRGDLHSYKEVDREMVVRDKEIDIIRSAGIPGNNGMFADYDTDKLKSLKPVSNEERSDKMLQAADNAGKGHDETRRRLKGFLGPDDPLE